MADTPIVQNPPVETPAPSGSQSFEPKTGIALAMEKLDAGVANLDKTIPPAPEPPKAAEEAPKVTPEPKKELPIAPEPEVGEGLWRTAPKHLKNDHFKFKRESEEKIQKAEAKIQELEGKSIQSPEDLKKIKAHEERIASLEKEVADRETRLIQADYSKSDEFKRLYIDKGTKAYAKAIGEVKTLKVKYIDQKTQEEMERPATENDFNNLRKLDPYEQDSKLDEMFGASAKRVAWHIAQLNSIEEEGNQAIEQAKVKAEEANKQTTAQRLKDESDYKTYEQTAREEITKANPLFVADTTNPEASKALEEGFRYVDDTLLNLSKMNPKERADSAAIMRAFVAATPRLMVEKKQLLAKVSGLESELAKYRKSDPSNAGTVNGSPAVTDGKTKSIKDAAAAFDSLKD